MKTITHTRMLMITLVMVGYVQNRQIVLWHVFPIQGDPKATMVSVQRDIGIVDDCVRELLGVLH